MIEHPRRPRLLLESAHEIGARRAGKDFQRHVPPDARVACTVDLPHPARPDEGKDLIRPELLSRLQFHWPQEYDEWMEQRAQELIDSLGLVPHPEGGFYRQVFKSPRIVVDDQKGDRAAITAIYFLLPSDQHSRWHRVTSDEVWVNLEGGGVALHTFDGTVTRTQRLGSSLPFAVVDAGVWQAAEPLDGFALVACFVAPGFEFADFSMMCDDCEAAAQLERIDAMLARLV
jgi:uncharacterized protein